MNYITLFSDISITDEMDNSEENDPEIIQLLLENEREALVEREELLSMQQELNDEIEQEENEIERLSEVLKQLKQEQIQDETSVSQETSCELFVRVLVLSIRVTNNYLIQKFYLKDHLIDTFINNC